MGRSQETFGKKERNKLKEKKKQDKADKKLARKDNETKGSFEDMLAYVDEYGNIVDTPPDPTKRKVVKAEDMVIGATKRDESDNQESFRTGIVTFFNDSKGYGFIKDKETQESIFVHINNTLEEIKENNVVQFETERGPKGLTAVNVKVAK